MGVLDEVTFADLVPSLVEHDAARSAAGSPALRRLSRLTLACPA